MQDILLHLDGGRRTPVLCDIALGLCTRFGASLTALFARTEPLRLHIEARTPSSHLAAATDRHRALFAAMTAGRNVETQWWQLPHGAPSYVVAQTALCARYADLVIVGQPTGDGDSPPDLIQEVVMQAGRPILAIPPEGVFPTIGETVAVAWNGSREAARSLHDALPFLGRAKTVKLLTIRGMPPSWRVPTDTPPLDLVARLNRKGVAVQHHHLVGKSGGKMDTLIHALKEMGADLLVMGAYGLNGGLHPFRSSATEYMLRHAPVPILLAH